MRGAGLVAFVAENAETISRMSSSSSTTRISEAMDLFLVVLTVDGGCFGAWEDDADHRSSAPVEIDRRVVQLKLSAMLFYDLLDDGRPRPVPFSRMVI